MAIGQDHDYVRSMIRILFLLMPLVFGTLPSAYAEGEGAAGCRAELTVTESYSARLGVDTREYHMVIDPKKHVSLRVTSELRPLAELNHLGLRRLTRATRALGLEGSFETRVGREVRINELRFQVPVAVEAAHRQASNAKPARTEFAKDFIERALLLRYVIDRHRGEIPNVYKYTFTNEALALRDLGEVAHLGETRFATQTWLGQFFRANGVKGAIMVEGVLPRDPPNFKDGPLRLTEGPTVLFFQPALR